MKRHYMVKGMIEKFH